MPPVTEVLEWRGQTMVGAGGDKIGKIEEIYLDTETDRPEWALVHTGLFGSASSFVPIANASARDGDVRVPFEKAQVKDAPKLEPDGRLSQQDESALYSHYGMDYSEDRSDSGLPEGEAAATTSADTSGAVGEDVSGPETDHAMTRSEEELRVGTTQRETGRVRLRKHIVTENVTQTVPVQREELRVEREPITDANRDAAGSGAVLRPTRGSSKSRISSAPAAPQTSSVRPLAAKMPNTSCPSYSAITDAAPSASPTISDMLLAAQ